MTSITRVYSTLPTAGKVAFFASLLGFVLSFAFTQTSTVNGVTSCSSFDLAKVVLGGVAVLGGVQCLLETRRHPKRYHVTAASVIGIASLPIGLLHLLTGFGLLLTSC